MKTFAQMTDWQKNVTALTILYLILEKKFNLDTMLEGDALFMDPFVSEMTKADLIKPSDKPGGGWLVTPKGFELRRQMVGMYDQMLQFEVFSAVNLGRRLTAEEALPDDSAAVYDTDFDPRFKECTESEDIRLAMIQFMNDAVSGGLEGKKIDPHTIVFMQKLIDGELDRENFWLDMRLGKIFASIEKIVSSSYKWQDMAEDEDVAAARAKKLYTAGMLELRKREGRLCANCGACLAIDDDNATKNKETLSACPACDNDLTQEAKVTESCPNCSHEILPRQRKCRGCGARISRKLPEGTVQTETVEYEDVSYTTVWSDSYANYGYAPYGYYDPYDMALDIAAFSFLCCAIW